MERTAWTDERLNERMAAIDRSFDGIHDELRGLRSDFAALEGRLMQIGFTLVGALLALTGALITALVVALT